MSEYVVGFGKPPKSTQFTKGQSGNPTGRPKGSQNLSAVFFRTMRQRVKVTEGGRARYITKFEAIVVQLSNKAVQGDLNAIHELRYWIQRLEESVESVSQPIISRENDEAILARALERIRNSEVLPSENKEDSADTNPIKEPQ